MVGPPEKKKETPMLEAFRLEFSSSSPNTHNKESVFAASARCSWSMVLGVMIIRK